VDDNGTTANATLDVNVIDDLPKAVTSQRQHRFGNQLTLTGNVLTNDVQGADRVPTGPVTAGTFTGTYGTLELHTDGPLHAQPDRCRLQKPARRRQWHRTFTYTITDSDGDTSTANLVLQIHNNDDPVVINGLNVNGGELTVYEKNLSTAARRMLH
jgi:VCBS repeat-containing protein